MSNAKRLTDMARHTVLRKLSDIGAPMNLLEIGFSATPQLVRNMAARGMVKVTVELTQRGRETLAAETAKRLRKGVNSAKGERIAARGGF